MSHPAFPMPLEWHDGRMVVASMWQNDDFGIAVTMSQPAPFYQVREFTERHGEWSWSTVGEYANLGEALAEHDWWES